MNPNWFNAMVDFHNTTRFIKRTWNVTAAIASHIQHVAARGASYAQCNEIAAAHFELTTQTGF